MQLAGDVANALAFEAGTTSLGSCDPGDDGTNALCLVPPGSTSAISSESVCAGGGTVVLTDAVGASQTSRATSAPTVALDDIVYITAYQKICTLSFILRMKGQIFV